MKIDYYFNTYGNSGYKLDQVQFADGTIWDVPTIKGMVIVGTEGVDWIRGYETNDLLNGLGGNDTIYGDLGNDILEGGAGADTLYGESGDDTLRGENLWGR